MLDFSGEKLRESKVVSVLTDMYPECMVFHQTVRYSCSIHILDPDQDDTDLYLKYSKAHLEGNYGKIYNFLKGNYTVFEQTLSFRSTMSRN